MAHRRYKEVNIRGMAQDGVGASIAGRTSTCINLGAQEFSMPLAGQEVTKSAVYQGVHAQDHEGDDMQFVLIEGELFPPCSHCGYGVQYDVVAAAPSLDEFAGFKKTKASAA